MKEGVRETERKIESNTTRQNAIRKKTLGREVDTQKQVAERQKEK